MSQSGDRVRELGGPVPSPPADREEEPEITIIERKAQDIDLSDAGLSPVGSVHRNPTTARLYTDALRNGDGRLAESGPIVFDTGRFTGRSPKDKHIVREPQSEDRIWWGGNNPISEDRYDGIRQKVTDYLSTRDLYVVDAFAGADPAHRIGVRVVTYSAYHALFAKTLFIDPTPEELETFEPQALVLHAPAVEADPDTDGTRTEVFTILHPTRNEVLIGGSFYAGEIKKSIFTIMNDRLPLAGVLPMHCSANVSRSGDVAIFFGLSGTGKTTLSADPERLLIGDDEHGWGTNGVFNIEGGCYAKTIRLSPIAEPDIWNATHSFGTVLENVIIDEDGVLDLDDDSKTENTRAAYKLERLSNVLLEKRAGHPSSVVFLTADAFGVLPPLARLSREQALYYFLSGFTSKLAGTELGVTSPEPTFSTCFGAPFLPQAPETYARMLGEKLDEHGSTVWLVNTGWTGGAFGEGHRMPIQATRELLRAALDGSLAEADYRVDQLFGFEVPLAVPGVDNSLLTPRETWSDKALYDTRARELGRMFEANFASKFPEAEPEIAAAGPRAA